MNIDTLILSGGGPSGIAYIGIFKALFEKKIIKQGLPDIKEIITTSVGIIFSILYMLDLTQDQIKKIIHIILSRFLIQNESSLEYKIKFFDLIRSISPHLAI